MGILNVTPDSFSDGGCFNGVKKALVQAKNMLDQGADIIDIGGVSTAPHITRKVEYEEERSRVVPVVKELVAHGINNLSIDTSNAAIAEEALGKGASWINDQSAGLNDKNMKDVMKKADAVVLMHNKANIKAGVDAGESVSYENLLDEIVNFFKDRMTDLCNYGLDEDKIILDPGLGFGKGLDDSLTILNNMHRFSNLAACSLIGASRKSFLAKLTGITEPKLRDTATVSAHMAAIYSGARIIRTHNVKMAYESVKVIDKVIASRGKDENIYQARR